MIPQKQLSLADIFEDCKDFYESDKPHFLTLLENHIDLDEIIPTSFYKHYYASTGRNRKYPLNAMLWALIIQRLLCFCGFIVHNTTMKLHHIGFTSPQHEFTFVYFSRICGSRRKS